MEHQILSRWTPRVIYSAKVVDLKALVLEAIAKGTMVLLASWGTVSDGLCADLMLFDASCHPDNTAFDRWAAGGPCPYSGAHVQRACSFQEEKALWGKGTLCKPYDLMLRLFQEKEIKFNEHSKQGGRR